MQILKITNFELVNQRIDKVLPILNNDLSRSQVQLLIKNKSILVNDKVIKPKYIVKLNDEIKIDDIKNDWSIEKENIPLDIVYEDDYLLVINKQRGLVVHPGNGNRAHTLVNALMYHIGKLSNIDKYRPGIVHRIDKDTSGMLIVAKNNKIHRLLSSQFADHKIHREYKALVSGVIDEDVGSIIAPIARSKNNPTKMCVDVFDGKEAESYFKVIKRFQNATLVSVKLKQGRTHQIRVHFEYIGHPIIGDKLYGFNNRNIIKDGQILHAYKISFFHPILKKKKSFTSETPEYFLDAIKIFNKIKKK